MIRNTLNKALDCFRIIFAQSAANSYSRNAAELLGGKRDAQLRGVRVADLRIHHLSETGDLHCVGDFVVVRHQEEDGTVIIRLFKQCWTARFIAASLTILSIAGAVPKEYRVMHPLSARRKWGNDSPPHLMTWIKAIFKASSASSSGLE